MNNLQWTASCKGGALGGIAKSEFFCNSQIIMSPASHRVPRNGRLEDALANLLQVQAAFLVQVASTNKDIAETQRENLKLNRKIEELRDDNRRTFAKIEAILLRHEQILERLPETIRQ